ncbi:hypothetical protein BDP27DRAFT_1212193 [Rhodocollybia butyracea]|uniref:FAD-binding PCMH-type domain-containing protein n=1 Tax=Rhodocollybia butyracea TaxID=206335 RepID=A0A9P5PZH5_9AGAR|nr:hypothetical protein BDP27DRAFT_1212193 [Rhodocollybia butyracea]
MKGFFKLVVQSAVLGSVLTSVALAQNSTQARIATTTCSQLQSSLGSVIVQTTSGPDYTLGANSAWSSFNTEPNFQPTCIVFANSTEHVQVAMKAIYKNQANYAVQAGGHSGMPGWNNVQDGVLISFKNMNVTTYNATTDTITMQPGIKWGNASGILEPFGVSPVGGRYADVGTGLLLGGGLSFLSPAFGYACDTFVSLDVVLVNGTLVTATVDNEYADLFKALKGGASRFGIYPNSSSIALLEAISEFAFNASDTNGVTALAWQTTPNATTGGINIVAEAFFFYNGTEEMFNKTFASFLAIPFAKASLNRQSYIDMVDLLSEPRELGDTFINSVLVGSPSQTPTAVAPYVETFQLFNEFSATYLPSGDINYLFLLITPVLPSQIAYGYERGGNAIQPPVGKGGYNVFCFQVALNEGINVTPPALQAGREVFLKDVPNTPGFPLFISEIDATQNAYATYGDFEFVKKTYAKYDPTRFNVRHTVGPVGL